MHDVKLPNVTAETMARVRLLDPVDRHRILHQSWKIRDRRRGWLGGRDLEDKIAEVEEARRRTLSQPFAEIRRLMAGAQ